MLCSAALQAQYFYTHRTDTQTHKRLVIMHVTGRWHAGGRTRLVGNVGAVVAVSVFVVDEEQDDSEEEADRAHGDVGDAQERVLPSHPRDGAEDHALAAIEAAHRII